MIKNCRQHSYGFQNLMSSWGVGVRFSKLQQVRDFSIFGSKSVTFYFFLFFLWGSKFWCSKVSFNVLHTLCTFRTCIYILKYLVKKCHNIPMGFKIWCQVGGGGTNFQIYSSKVTILFLVLNLLFCFCFFFEGIIF